jgi:hypothetical protein
MEFVRVFVSFLQNGLQSPEKPMNQPFNLYAILPKKKKEQKIIVF